MSSTDAFDAIEEGRWDDLREMVVVMAKEELEKPYDGVTQNLISYYSVASLLFDLMFYLSNTVSAVQDRVLSVYQQKRGNTLLIQAAMLGNEDVVDLLLRCGADIEARNYVSENVTVDNRYTVMGRRS